MRPARPISQRQIEELEAKGAKIKGRREYRRLQSVLLRAKENRSPEEIGAILGIHPRTVQKHQRRYFEEGLAAFDAQKPGKKGPQCLSAEAEAELFEGLRQQAAEGQLVNTQVIHLRFEEKAGKACSKNTIYRALRRNRWSKKQPRPRHPKGNEEAKSLFKKTATSPTENC